MYESPTAVTYSSSASSEINPVVILIYLVIWGFLIVTLWKVFVKAGRPGWASIVPIYNIYIMLQMVGRPVWWLVLFFIPVVNFVVSIMLYIDIAKAFGKSTAFGIFGLLIFPFVGWPMLAFGSAQYQGAAPAVAPPPPPAPGTPPAPPAPPAPPSAQ